MLNYLVAAITFAFVAFGWPLLTGIPNSHQFNPNESQYQGLSIPSVCVPFTPGSPSQMRQISISTLEQFGTSAKIKATITANQGGQQVWEQEASGWFHAAAEDQMFDSLRFSWFEKPIAPGLDARPQEFIWTLENYGGRGRWSLTELMLPIPGSEDVKGYKPQVNISKMNCW